MKLWLKVFLLNTLLLTVLAVFILLAVRQVVTTSLRAEQTRHGLTIAHNLADRVADLLLLEDVYQAEKTLESVLGSEEDLQYAFVVGLDGRTFAHTFGAGPPTGLMTWNPTGGAVESVQLLDTEAGIIRDVGVKVFDGLAAELHLGLPETRIEAALVRIRDRIVLASSVAIFGAWLLSSLFSRYLTRPVNRLVAHTERLARGEFGGQVGVTGKGEFGELAATFNALSRELALYRQRMEESFRQMLRAEKLSALGRLSAGLAHEIRNPLTSIKVLFQSFRESSPPSRQDLDVVLAETERMETLLRRFLACTRIEEAEPTSVDVNELLEHVLQMSRFQLVRQDVEVEANLNEVSPVLADRAMIEQVLLNLVLNAIEAMPGGGTLGIDTAEVNSLIEIRVRDSGGGIPETIQDKVFDPFFTTKEEGTGLGLSVAYNIVEHFGGSIDFRCEEGGTIFLLRLPAMKSGETVSKTHGHFREVDEAHGT